MGSQQWYLLPDNSQQPERPDQGRGRTAVVIRRGMWARVIGSVELVAGESWLRGVLRQRQGVVWFEPRAGFVAGTYYDPESLSQHLAAGEPVQVRFQDGGVTMAGWIELVGVAGLQLKLLPTDRRVLAAGCTSTDSEQGVPPVAERS